jgi:hypothetical protein
VVTSLGARVDVCRARDWGVERRATSNGAMHGRDEDTTNGQVTNGPYRWCARLPRPHTTTPRANDASGARTGAEECVRSIRAVRGRRTRARVGELRRFCVRIEPEVWRGEDV